MNNRTYLLLILLVLLLVFLGGCNITDSKGGLHLSHSDCARIEFNCSEGYKYYFNDSSCGCERDGTYCTQDDDCVLASHSEGCCRENTCGEVITVNEATTRMNWRDNNCVNGAYIDGAPETNMRCYDQFYCSLGGKKPACINNRCVLK